MIYQRRSLPHFISIAIIIILGLSSKKYQGIGYEWVNDFSGDVFYEIFWCLFISLFYHTKKLINQIPIWVFIVTSIIEFSQLWKHPVLEIIRATFWGKLLLGTTFSWLDFPHYLLGCMIGWLWIKKMYH